MQMHTISQLVFVSKVGCGGTGIKKIIRHVRIGHVGEPKFARRVDRETRRVDGLEPILALEHPINVRFRPSIRCCASNAKGITFLNGESLGRFVLEVVQFGFPDEYGVG